MVPNSCVQPLRNHYFLVLNIAERDWMIPTLGSISYHMKYIKICTIGDPYMDWWLLCGFMYTFDWWFIHGWTHGFNTWPYRTWVHDYETKVSQTLSIYLIAQEKNNKLLFSHEHGIGKLRIFWKHRQPTYIIISIHISSTKTWYTDVSHHLLQLCMGHYGSMFQARAW